MRDSMRTGKPLGRAATARSRDTATAHSRSKYSSTGPFSTPVRSASSAEALNAARVATPIFYLQAPPRTHRYRPAVPTARQLPTTMQSSVINSQKSGSLMNSSTKRSLGTSTGFTDLSLVEQGHGQHYEAIQEFYTGRLTPPNTSVVNKSGWLAILWEEVKWTWQTGPSDSPFGKGDSLLRMQRLLPPSSNTAGQPAVTAVPNRQDTNQPPRGSGRLLSDTYENTKDSRIENDFAGSEFTSIAKPAQLPRSRSVPTAGNRGQQGRTFSLVTTGHSQRPLDEVTPTNSERVVLQRSPSQARPHMANTPTADRRKDTAITDTTRISDYFAARDHEGRIMDSDRIKKCNYSSVNVHSAH
jgi:hypothetical protein